MNSSTLLGQFQAIETRHKGRLYRSRLEARWSIFFDAQGIAFEYELEGVNMGPAGWYLPDFYLLHVGMWAEVKPIEFTPEQLAKCRALVMGTGRPCLLLVGSPDCHEYDALYRETHDGRSDVVRFPHTLSTETKWYKSERRFPVDYCLSQDDFDNLPHYTEAVEYARSARFE